MLKQRSLPLQKPTKRPLAKMWLGINSSLVLLIIVAVWQLNNHNRPSTQPQLVLPLLSLSPQQRESQLKTIANAKQSVWDSITSAVSQQELQPNLPDRNIARYLLAVDLLQQQQGTAALNYLQGLEADYPLLAPLILVKQAQAYQLANQTTKVGEIYQQLINNYPDSPVVPEVLFWLSPTNPKFQQQLIKQFPYHPLTQKLARQLLKHNQNRFDLLLLLAKYSRTQNLDSIRDKLVLQHPEKLTPEDWEAIASGYWQDGEYRKAADSYILARLTPRNLYRAARGFHLNGNISEARSAYQRLTQEFHDARETGLAWLHLASISGGQEALAYLDIAIDKFPTQAAQALLSQGVIYDALKQPELANQVRQQLLQQYPRSEAAVMYRWQLAQKLAAQGDLSGAYSWVQPITTLNLNFELLPQAIFWAGKWAKELGQLENAQQAFKQVITYYPQSYYAWRSAVFLGWKVGDFNNLRQFQPSLDFSPIDFALPAGSDLVGELFFLGQYQDAWTLLESEIKQPQEPTVPEQFTESALLLKLGQTRTGIQQIWNLAQRDEPQDQKQWQSLRQQSGYWYNLFPFPYRDSILTYSQQQKINPLLVISVMRKESTFDPEIDSPVGAIGLMQIVPPTAQWVATQIDLEDYSLKKPSDNIKIGTWYLAHNHHRYDNNSLFAIASYNAGTGNVNLWLKQYSTTDLDRFVEQIPFPETKDYVEGVFSNYWNYLRLYDPNIKNQINRYRNLALKAS